MEQYIETIADLLTRGRVCSISEIASDAEVSRPAASRAIRELTEKGFVEHQAYGYVVLTAEGEALARRLSARHRGLYRFLSSVLRYDDAAADSEACRLEHLVDDDFVARLAQLAVFMETDPAAGDRWHDRINQHLDQTH
jgi:DtxR family Mn-dependent transcriptional regulator